MKKRRVSGSTPAPIVATPVHKRRKPGKVAKTDSEGNIAKVLDRNSAIPLYHQLAQYLEGEIASGRFPTGHKYYSDRKLVEMFEISLLTVRQAVNELVEKRLLTRQRGSGTFVLGSASKLAARMPGGSQDSLLFTGWRLEALSRWDSMYFRDIFDGIREEAQARGLMLVIDDMAPMATTQAVEEIRRRRIKGVLALEGSDTKARARLFSSVGLPVVTINCTYDGLAGVMPDHASGGRQIVEHLLALGHRHFVHLNSGERTPHWVEVERAYRATITGASLDAHANPVFHSTLNCGSIEAGYECMKLALQAVPQATAVVAGNDLMAIGAMRYLREEGRQVPREISVTGFDDIAAGQICEPPLTTIHVDRIEVGRASVRQVFDHPEETSARIVVPVSVLARTSAAAPPRVLEPVVGGPTTDPSSG